MELHESGQMYLETIYVLLQKNSKVRAIEVSTHIGYTRASVSRAVNLLRKGGYITVDKDGYISLTSSGEEVAKKIYERHVVIKNMLVSLGIDEETATEDACRIEHVISDKSFAAIKNHYLNHNS
jgi:Mn-dependent DtxR family transcriptional regulator